MKVKIKDTIYDSEKEPIVIILEHNDKINILNMASTCTKYCSYPNKFYSIKEIEKFMET